MRQVWNEINCENKCNINSCDLSNVSKAKEINLSSCKLKRIPIELRQATNLEVLKLGENKIKIIENIPDSVKSVILNRNKIESLEGLPNVERLFMQYNNIKTLDNIPNSVKFLAISGNKIRSINGKLPRGLLEVNINSNKIERLKKNDIPPNLRLISYHYNPIDYVDPKMPYVEARGGSAKFKADINYPGMWLTSPKQEYEVCKDGELITTKTYNASCQRPYRQSEHLRTNEWREKYPDTMY